MNGGASSEMMIANTQIAALEKYRRLNEPVFTEILKKLYALI